MALPAQPGQNAVHFFQTGSNLQLMPAWRDRTALFAECLPWFDQPVHGADTTWSSGNGSHAFASYIQGQPTHRIADFSRVNVARAWQQSDCMNNCAALTIRVAAAAAPVQTLFVIPSDWSRAPSGTTLITTISMDTFYLTTLSARPLGEHGHPPCRNNTNNSKWN
jgi:hypothetical protein